MQMLFVFLFCLLTREVILTIEAHAADEQDLPTPSTKIIRESKSALSLVAPPAERPASAPKVNTLMQEAVKCYSDHSSFVYHLPDPSWDLAFLEALWKLSTIQGPGITTASVFKPEPEGEVKQAEQKSEALREENLTFAFVIGGVHACYWWKNVHFGDVTAFIEKASGFKRDELKGISAESLTASPVYQHNVQMLLGRLMGYLAAKGSSVKAGLNGLEKLYEKTIVATVIKDYRQDKSVNLEALFTKISGKYVPLFPHFKNLFKVQRDKFPKRRLVEDIWESNGIQLYTSVLGLPDSDLWTLSLYEMSTALAKREPEVFSDDEDPEEDVPAS